MERHYHYISSEPRGTGPSTFLLSLIRQMSPAALSAQRVQKPQVSQDVKGAFSCAEFLLAYPEDL